MLSNLQIFMNQIPAADVSKKCGDKPQQELLHKITQTLQCLMGIGAGGNPLESGEKLIFNELRKKCNSPYCVFDIGANKGQFLRVALEEISDSAVTVHCFEPGKKAFSLLVEQNKDDRVKFNNIAIGKEKENGILYYNSEGSGIASLTKRRLDHLGIKFNKSEIVQIETVDNYCDENNIKRINLLKIDVEGHELDVLSGAKKMFVNKMIDIVVFEFGGCNIDTRTFFQDFWYFFVNLDMSLFRITPSGYFFPIESYKEIYEQFKTTNFIAIRRDVL